HSPNLIVTAGLAFRGRSRNNRLPTVEGGSAVLGRSPEGTRARDREFGGAFLFAGGLAASALLGYAFNATMGRRLSPGDFGTFAALLAVLLALSGPTTALFGGAAMSAARDGRIVLPQWRFWIA